MKPTWQKAQALCLALALFLLMAPAAMAAGTDSGVTITNQATLDFAVGGVGQPQVLSDSDGATPGAQATTFLVDNRTDLTMTGNNNAAASGTGNVLVFTVENTGNTTQGYALDLFTGLNGTDDIIDMNNVAVYLDVNNNGTYEGGTDTVYTPGSGANIADVPANSGAASIIQILVVADVPGGSANGDTASYTLKATTLNAGTAVVTTATAGGDTAGVDVVLADGDAGAGVNGSADGATNGQYLATATYTVSTATMAISKSAAVISDPINGAVNPKAIPGATVRYTIVITNSGVPSADTVVIIDPIPTNTDFVVGSVTESGGTGVVSYSDDNAVSFVYVPGGVTDPAVTHVQVSIPTIAGGGGSTTITFDVVIE